MSERISIGISQPGNDLYFDSLNSLVMVRDALAVGQHIRQRLQTFIGEWFLDTAVGVPWLDQILGRKYDPALAEAVVKAEILKTDGVVEITSFAVSFLKETRGLRIRSIEVLTDYDEVIKV